jgi:hypothetical protein
VRLNPSRDLPIAGDLCEDLTRWVAELIVHYAHPVNASLLRGAAATAGVAETDCTRARRGEIALLLDRTDRAVTTSTITMSGVRCTCGN